MRLRYRKGKRWRKRIKRIGTGKEIGRRRGAGRLRRNKKRNIRRMRRRKSRKRTKRNREFEEEK